uniref:EF-hand domain-containing protein n=1 Tax=Anopheles minimus TaxID=112268 RepID=A0A182W187_9DIPT
MGPRPESQDGAGPIKRARAVSQLKEKHEQQHICQQTNTGLYAHYVFNTLDKEHTGILSFENFVQGLSILSRGTLEEKLCWTFSLYDINHDGKITREEMTDIVTAIYELMGARDDGGTDEINIKSKVDTIFQKMDTNRDGVITIEEFLDCCRKDQLISSSMGYEDDSDQPEPKGNDGSNENSNEGSLQTAILKSDTSNGPTTTTAGSIANRMEQAAATTTTTTTTATTTVTAGSEKTQTPPTSGATTSCLQQQENGNGSSLTGQRTSRTSKQSILVNGRAKTNVAARHPNHLPHHHHLPSHHHHHPCSTAQQQPQQSQQPLLKHYHIPLQDTYHTQQQQQQQQLQPLHPSTLRLGQGSCYAPPPPPPPPPLPSGKLAPPQTLSLALPPCNGSYYLGQLSASSSTSSSHQQHYHHHHHHHHHHHLQQPTGRIATISSPMSPPGSCCGGGALTRPTELNCCPIAVDPSQQLRVAPQPDVPTPTLVKVKAWYTVTKQGLTY